MDGRIYLKVKIINLADEDRTIRRLMRRAGSVQKNSMASHRRFTVKTEARSALLAYAFIRGIPYLRVERSTRKPPDWKRIEQLVKKYAIDDQVIWFDLKGRRYIEDLDQEELSKLEKFLDTYKSGKLLEGILKDFEVWKTAKLQLSSDLPLEDLPKS